MNTFNIEGMLDVFWFGFFFFEGGGHITCCTLLVSKDNIPGKQNNDPLTSAATMKMAQTDYC